MPKLTPIAFSVACALSLTGCAGLNQTSTDRTTRVEPTFGISHGGVTVAALYRLGRFFEGQARYAQAIFAYREVLKRNPHHVAALNGLGMSLAETGKHDEAITQFQAAIAISAGSAYLHNNLGYVLLLKDSNEEAVKALEEAQRLDPNPERAATYNLGLAREGLGAAAKARQTAEAGTRSPQSVVVNAITPAIQVTSAPSAGVELVQVSPSVYELRTPANRQPPQEAAPAQQAAPVQEASPAQETTASLKPFRLEISNGNGITRMAKRVSGHLSRAGIRTMRLTNQRPFQQHETEIHYRNGYAAEAAALARKLQPKVQLVPSKELAGHIDVRLVLGRDELSDRALVILDTQGRIIAARSFH